MSSKPGLGGRDLAAERAAARSRLGTQTLIPQGGLPTARLSELMPSPENGRKQLHKVEELASSLKSDGMNTAMTVIPPAVFIAKYPQHKDAVEAAVASGVRYVVHHGHRRLAAAEMAQLESVPILIRDEVPSLRIAAIQENLQRMGLNPIEEGEEFQKALDEEVDEETGKPYSQRSLATRVGASQTYISQRVALLRLVPQLQEAVVNHWLKEQDVPSAGEGKILLPVRTAATVYARLIPALQRTLLADPSDAAVVCKLREDLQAAFLDDKLTLEEAAEISKLAHSQQKMPELRDTTKDEPPTQSAPLVTPAPTTGESDTRTPPVPTPRDGGDELNTEASNSSGPAPDTTLESVPETTAPDTTSESVPDFSEPTGQSTVSDSSEQPEAEEPKASVVTAAPRVIEIGSVEDLDQLVLTLNDTLTEEERTYVREHLV
ncbi:ParB/RepB/Spo0J family partition protein [Streptomyces sp. NPDC051572]|uniref:ParB/RepB/Spo0J family partition protein n=1 Tax=Streptomyces sp. NPDC051572 TaxID=3155802 RepID=UPI00344DCE5E